MHVRHVSQVTIYLHPQLVPPVQQYQHSVRYAVMLQRALLAIVDITWHLLARALFVRISQTAVPVTKLLIHVRHVSQVTIYLHPQLAPHVQQYQHNAPSAATHRFALPAILAIFWLVQRLVNCSQITVSLN
jgi:hypothetical protein